jgi:uncharacterized protein DUF2846
MRSLRGLPLAVALLFAWALAVTPAFAQAPPAQPPPSEEEEKDEGPGDEIKEDEPTTPEGKAQKKEWERKACPAADVKFDAETDKTAHPAPEPPEGKAMVFVIRPTRQGGKIQTKVAVDGEWKGANRGNNYLHFAVDPGQRFVCSKAENKSVLAFKAEAGKTYYLQQKIKMGLMKARNQVVLLTEEEGRKGLAKCHPSISNPKK